MTTDIQTLKSIGGLEEAVKNLAQVAIRMDDKALAERQAIYDRVDALRESVANLTTDLRQVVSDVDELKPEMKTIRENYQRSLGARRFGKFIWGVIISVATIAIAILSQVVPLIHHAIMPTVGH